ncbi:Glutamate 5-kinase [uncultured delta proteobacterium]|uniref:Glutamate 5-kinase n=1 Tax=uncultured delta proteobacterium TaxID=34034 RepID=A0A212KD38_9DELT|nr:Glutamate 5-kinase [uncultured delta proteobacterium]
MDWKQEKRQYIAKSRRVVVKVGSAVLASGEGLDLDRVERLAAQLAAVHDTGREVILVSSGAVAAGRGVMRAKRAITTTDLPNKQAAAAIGQSRLMHAYDQAFASRGKVSAQVLLTRDDMRSRQRFLNARNTFATLLEWGAIPVVNENDTVAVSELKFGDNDNLSGLLLNLTEADLFINLTSARGVFDADPGVNPDARVMDCIDDIRNLDVNALCGAKTALGSGGMHSKLLAACRAAQIGVPTYIVPGREEGILERVFAEPDATLGTWVRPSGKAISSRKFWLAYNADAAGTLTIDAGAVKALVKGGKSLLPAGIVAVSGNFGQGALVTIVGPGKEPVGVGLCNYAAGELRRVMGKSLAGRAGGKADEDVPYAEAVHRDNMLLHAAV